MEEIMITFKKFGETIKIRGDHWKRLRARYNPEKAKLDDEVYAISVSCPFCNKYSCKKCPFGVFGDEYGCYTFFERFFPMGKEFDSDDITQVDWYEEDDKQARRQLARLQRMMDKIEASQ
jgi:hypothetical protein